jgi:hypothetical protein
VQDTTLVQDIMSFVHETFPLATPRGQYIKLSHEYEELGKAETPEDKAEELADVIFVAIGLAALTNIDIVKILRDKLTKNQNRKWIHTGQGVYQHVKE